MKSNGSPVFFVIDIGFSVFSSLDYKDIANMQVNLT